MIKEESIRIRAETIRIGLSGAGGVGKTSVMNEVAKKLEIKILPSITRDYYKEKGVTNEKEAFSWTPEEQFEFQSGLFYRFIDYIRDNSVQGESFICDRTIVDHFAWTFYANSNIKIEEINRLKLAIRENMRFFTDLFYFPYPCSWHVDTQSSDSFRFDPPYKNFILDSIIYKGLCEANAYLQRTYFTTVPDKSIEDRADYIVNCVKLPQFWPTIYKNIDIADE